MMGLQKSLICGVAAPLFMLGCAVGAEDGEATEMPDRASFPLVSDALERRCATLDCHGNSGRNLRLYSGSGLRLNAADIPGYGTTTELEYDESYRSVVGLEPEVMSKVIAEHGREPERLTLVRKARALEDHKGGAMLLKGDPADKCVLSWLASSIDEPSCTMGAELAPPLAWPDAGVP